VRSAPCTWGRETRVSWLSLKTKVAGFLWFSLKTGGKEFHGLGLKTGSFSLVIWALKSPRRFFGLSFKTKQASVCRLRHKTDGGRTAWDTH
jgi:hypothetical protein